MTDRALLDRYERWFRENPDPWNFEHSPYEAAKRAATLRACGDRPARRALELGAANGVLALELAQHADAVVAIEAVPAAAALARDRLAPFPRVNVVTGLIPGDVPDGPYDLVVASEILYYLDTAAYQQTLAMLPLWLAPGGRLVAVHHIPSASDMARSAATVHDDLNAHPALRLSAEDHTPDYLLSVLRGRAPAE